MIDTASRIATPEGVHLTVSPAGPIARALALMVDIAIRSAVLLLAWLGFSLLGEFGIGLGLMTAFLMEWLYPTFFEVLRDGATPGKRLFHLRVIHDSGVPVGWSGSLIRNLLRFVDFLPFAYGFGFLAVMAHPQFKRLGDLAANTLVVYDNPATARIEMPDISPLRPQWDLAPQEQLAIVTFAERSVRMNEARAEEIAQVLAPLDGAEVTLLRRYAAWLQGER